MLFDTTTAPQLKPWLVRTLEPICDAEPGALAEYILALLKHNVPETEMRKELTAQLDEFLEKDTLFTVLRTKSYLPYATDSAPKGPRADSGIPIPLESGPSLPDSRGQKRSMEYDDRDGRPAKGPRLNDGPGQFPRLPNGMNQQPWNGNGLGGMIGMGGGMGGGGMGAHMNGRRPHAYQPPDMRRGLCRDYHNNGFCARGETCKYSHGEEAVVPGQFFPGPSMPYMQGMFQNGGMPYGGGPGMGGGGGAYNPNESQLDMRPSHPPQGGMGMGMGPPGGMMGGRNRPPMMHREGPAPRSGELPVIQDLTPQVPKDESQPQPIPTSDTTPTNGAFGMHMDVDDAMNGNPGFRPMRGGRGRGAPHGNGNGHGQGTAQNMRPTKGRGDKTLVIEKIPEDNLSLDAVNGWFKRFGTVTNVAIDARSAKALITFAEHEEAHAAWKSQDAVFGNRFVKLFWHRPMEGHGQGGQKALAASAPLVAKVNAPPPPPQPTTAPPPTPKPPRKASAPNATVASLAAKQKLLEEQIAEQKSLMGQLGSASADEKKTIMARLRKLGEEMKPAPSPAATPGPTEPKDREAKERERLDKELEGHSSTPQPESSAEPNTEDLKAKLARLKAEAASLGLPEALADASGYNAPYPGFRGRGRGRARGGFYRGAARGGPPPRASMKLDNRPKKLLVKGVADAGVQAVRDWFETTGQVDSLDAAENGDLVVAFKTRAAAEQGLAKGFNIPQVGPVQITWVSGQSIKKITTSTHTEPPGMDTGADEDAPPAQSVDKPYDAPPVDEEEEVAASGWGGDEDEDGMGML
ncbi:hypothetical protein HWV62_30346 [Athelia sp. TMB]|nr:hypothetical protein HWV62_30346 [Athelia sp. TMB]